MAELPDELRGIIGPEPKIGDVAKIAIRRDPQYSFAWADQVTIHPSAAAGRLDLIFIGNLVRATQQAMTVEAVDDSGATLSTTGVQVAADVVELNAARISYETATQFSKHLIQTLLNAGLEEEVRTALSELGLI